MTYHHPCSCGYEASSADDLGDHLAEAFTPADDKGTDGKVHAEAASETTAAGTAGATRALACLCGYLAGGITRLDAHLLAAFTPGDAVDRAGVRHAPLAEP